MGKLLIINSISLLDIWLFGFSTSYVNFGKLHSSRNLSIPFKLIKNVGINLFVCYFIIYVMS
jgi:hypothetical protein